MNKKGETINWEQEEIDISAERLIDEEIDEELNLVMNAFIEKLGLNQKDLTEEHMKSLLKLSYATIMKENISAFFMLPLRDFIKGFGYN